MNKFSCSSYSFNSNCYKVLELETPSNSRFIHQQSQCKLFIFNKSWWHDCQRELVTKYGCVRISDITKLRKVELYAMEGEDSGGLHLLQYDAAINCWILHTNTKFTSRTFHFSGRWTDSNFWSKMIKKSFKNLRMISVNGWYEGHSCHK